MCSVISILANVDDADRRVHLGNCLDLESYAPRQMHAAGPNADKHQLVGVRRLLDNLVGHAAQGSTQFLLLQQNSLLLAHGQKKDPPGDPRESSRIAILKLLSSCNLFRSHRTELKGIIFCNAASIESQSRLHRQLDELSGELAVLNAKFSNCDGQFESSRSGTSGIHEQNSVTDRYRRLMGMATDHSLIASRNRITIQVLHI